MNYSKSDEIIFIYIVNGLIELNKNPDYIINFLQANNLCSKRALNNFNRITFNILGKEWRSIDGWISISNFLNSNTEGMSDKNNKDNICDSVEDKERIYIEIKDNHKSISYIEELKLEHTVLAQGIEIKVSHNDIGTLLRNMASIQAKLNETIKYINRITKLINGYDVSNIDENNGISNNDENTGKIAFSENEDQVLLKNMAYITSKLNEVTIIIKKINDNII